MFRVKICGITTPDDGRDAFDAGADAIGLNFYVGSRRFVDRQRAASIVGALPPGAIKVGVFVNAPAAEMRNTAGLLSLDFIQLHGDEPPEVVAELGDLPVIRTFRLDSDGWRSCRDYLDRCRQMRTMPQAVLVDAFRHGEYGGTGESPDWATVREYHGFDLGVPLILAGGLTETNVGNAIEATRPYGVDTASGVESAPGIKDKNKMAAFVAAARQALGQ